MTINAEKLALTALVTLSVGAAGCGGGSSGGQVRNADPWQEGEVATAAGLVPDEDGLSWQTSSGCDVSVVMTSKSAVDLYSGAGDPVVTNEDGTAGVKFDGSAACAEELARGLATLR